MPRWGALAVACVAMSVCGAAFAQATQARDLLKALNEPTKQASAQNTSADRVFGAWTKVPPPPTKSLDATAVWPGMKEWSAVAAWAQGASAVGDALIATQNTLLLGLPYGTDGVSPAFREAGIVVNVGEGKELGVVSFDYLTAVRGIGVYAVAEMYRAGEAGEFERAADVGVAWLRFLRHVADRQMLAEVQFGLDAMVEGLSIHRDFLWRYREKVPPSVLKNLGLKEYPRLALGDGERLRRLTLPEGDLLLAKAVLERTFPRGKASGEEFVKVYGEESAADAPLMRFGAAKTWRKVAELHGARDATLERLETIYEDWRLRWRSKPYGKLITEQATALSTTNKVRYAAVLVSLGEMHRLFEARRLLSASINGTAVSAGLCGYRQEFSNRWPKDIKSTYTLYLRKRLDQDPYKKEKDPSFCRFEFAEVSSPRSIQTPTGAVTIEGFTVWSIGADHADDQGKKHTPDGSSGDIVFWPPLREVAREAKP